MTITNKPDIRLTGTLFDNVKLDYNREELTLLAQMYEQASPLNKDKQIVTGNVIKITDKDVLLDFNGKANGIVPITDFKDMPNLKIGDSVEIYVEQEENMKGELVVSRRSAQLVKSWQRLHEALKTGEVLEGLVKRKIRGGLVLDIMSIEVFLPGSQIDISQVTDFDQFIGKILEVAVAKINTDKDNVVVSRKMLIAKEQSKQRKALLVQLEIGQILSGEVKNVTEYGVFIELGGGITGLLYKGDIAHNKKIEKVDEVKDPDGKPLFDPKSSPPQRIDVAVKSFDLEKGHIALSTKMLAWASLPEDITKGKRIKVKVRDINESFTLVELEKGITGLLHISEMSHSNRVKHPKELISLDQELEVEVIEIDREKQSLRVGMKQLQSNPWHSEAIKKYTARTRHIGKICSVAVNGVYIEFEPAIEGFLSRNQMSWTQKIHDINSKFKEGNEVEVMVIGQDTEKRLLALSLCELEENPWNSFRDIFSTGSVHQGTITKIIPQKGAIVELSHGLENFVPIKDLPKNVAIGETHNFYVIEFAENEKRVVLTYEANQEKNKSREKYNVKSTTNATLGDIDVLQQIKKELAQKDKEDRT